MKALDTWLNRLKKRGDQLPMLSERQVNEGRYDEPFVELMRGCEGIDKFSETLYTTYKVTEYLLKNDLPGDFIECGVYKGRHIITMASTLLQQGVNDRNIYLYDTFAGMTEPGKEDARRGKKETPEQLAARWESKQQSGRNLIRYAGQDEVRQRVATVNYPDEHLHFVAGDIRKTVPNDFHRQIAFLRLDTDWYELTMHELVHFYDLVVPGGVIVIDDYGSHEGARKAVDEFFTERGSFPLLTRTTKSERLILKR